MSQTALRMVVFPLLSMRYSWRLETSRGGHFVVVMSGTAYLTSASARAGFKRFRQSYLREDAPISESRPPSTGDTT